MQIEYVREFVILTTNMSFSETAKKLFITQSALSRHITALEDELGAKLFERDTHSMRLTDVGRGFLIDAQLLLNAYDSALNRVDAIKSSSKRILRIGYLYDAGREFLPRISQILAEKAADITVQYRSLEYGELMNQLLEHRIDVALTIETSDRARDKVRRVYLREDNYCAVVPQGHPWQNRAQVELSDFIDQKVIFPDPQAMGDMNRYFSSALNADSLGIRPSGYYRDIPSLMFQIEQGEGVSIAWDHHSCRYGDMAAFVPLANSNARCRICLMWAHKTEKDIPGCWSQALCSLGQTDAKDFPTKKEH